MKKTTGQRSIFEVVTDSLGLTSNKWELRVDGASRGNPGQSGAGIYIKKNSEDFYKDGFFLGTRTNNEAEYLAVLIGVLVLKKDIKKGEHLTIISDSQLLICQFNGSYRVKKPELKVLNDAVVQQLQGIYCTFVHVERAYNAVADALANQGIDKKQTLPLKVLDVFKNYDISF